ncbi:MAG TPA: ATP-binding protein [Polyangiaceae bacterium]|jgi:signal transduction histidine kinase
MKYRVLYVDDDPANLYVFEAACANEFEVRTAGNAEAALEILRRSDVAVLLTDQRMPGTTGVELAAAAREQFPDTIRMLVTAYADLDSAIDAINWGQVHRYLRKPWDIRELRATLKEACELYWMNREIADLRRRLLETERVYAIGVVATSIGRELTRPIGQLNESLAMARRSIETASKLLGAFGDGSHGVRVEVDAVDAQLASAQLSARGVFDLLRGIDLPVRERPNEAQKVALDEVIRLTLQVLRGEFRTRAQVRLDVRPVPPVRSSTASMGQVVLNLLVNALQSFPASAGREPSASDNLVTVRLFPRAAYVCMEVEDNGVPIPKESIGHMFDPLSQRVESGNRLGLAISKRIVEELGGRLDAEQLAEGGTRLRLVLPAATEDTIDR